MQEPKDKNEVEELFGTLFKGATTAKEQPNPVHPLYEEMLRINKKIQDTKI